MNKDRFLSLVAEAPFDVLGGEIMERQKLWVRCSNIFSLVGWGAQLR